MVNLQVLDGTELTHLKQQLELTQASQQQMQQQLQAILGDRAPETPAHNLPFLPDGSNQLISNHNQLISNPNQLSSSPNQLTSNPNQLISYPNQLTSNPNQLISYPNQLTSNPNQLISYPNQLTSNPNQLISSKSQNRNVKNPPKPESTMASTDSFHVLGPNCYIKTETEFKLIGPASLCIKDRKSNSKSIWDSLTSIPILNTFAKTIGFES